MTVATEPTAAPLLPPVPKPRARYIGIDLARFLAIAGMMAAHLVALQTQLPNVEGATYDAAFTTGLITNGTAAALFAVLGGLSIVFATRRLLREGRTGAAIGSIALRGVILMLIGLLLGLLESDIVVVLAYYGLAMILVSPLIALRGWILATIATVVGLGGGILNVNVRRSIELVYEIKPVSFDLLFSDPGTALRALLLTGEYPVITWSVYLLVGILIGRTLVAATARGALGRTAALFAGCGAVLTVIMQALSTWILANLTALGIIARADIDANQLPELIMHMNYGAPALPHPWGQLIAVPHSGSVGDLLRTIGIAAAVIGALVWLCDRERVAARTPGPMLNTVRAAGAAPLTIYTLHILVSGILYMPYTLEPSLWLAGPVPWWIVGFGAFAIQLIGALIIGAVLAKTGRRGPLEFMLSKIVGLCIPSR